MEEYTDDDVDENGWSKSSASGKFENRYNPKLHPIVVKLMMQNGMGRKQIVETLGMSDETFNKWMHKYPDFKKAVQEGRKPIDENVVNALYKSAIGYEYYEIQYEPKKLTAKEREEAEDNGRYPKNKLVKTKVVKKRMYPNVIAQIFWLKNRLPEMWRDKVDTQVFGEITYKVQPLQLNQEKQAEDAQMKILSESKEEDGEKVRAVVGRGGIDKYFSEEGIENA